MKTCPTCGSIGFEPSQIVPLESTDGYCIMCRPIYEAFITGYKIAFLAFNDCIDQDTRLKVMAEAEFKKWMSEKRKEKKSNATISG